MTQCQIVEQHLKTHGSITALEAMQEYGIMRLASRVADLRRGGLPIIATMETGKNRYGEQTHFARYILQMTEEQAYEKLCQGCWRESQCHEDMNYCDKYLQATEEADND